MKEALYYSKSKEIENAVECVLCPKQCVIPLGERGICRARQNEKGKLYSLIYEEFSSSYIEPVENKQLYHFHPGKKFLSLGSVGCNLGCIFCNQYNISHSSLDETPTHKITTDESVMWAKQYLVSGIAYDYNEPIINYEYMIEAMVKARKYSLKNILVTNGFINEEPLRDMLLYVDAVAVGIKSFNNDFFQTTCKGDLDVVLKNVEILIKEGIHVELNFLLIPNVNDKVEEIESFVDWVASINPQIPVHFLRYFPLPGMKGEITSLVSLINAKSIAQKKLKFVYLGNIFEGDLNDTYCPSCGARLIRRKGQQIEKLALDKVKCTQCGNKINIVM